MHGSIHSLATRLTLTGTLAATAAAQAFAGGGTDMTTGNLAVVKVGTGAAALSTAATAVFIEERTTAGALVTTLNLPTAAAGPQLPYTLSGTATSEGFMSLSADGQYLVLAGFSAVPGTTAIAGTSSATVPRVIARIRISDNSIDTSTSMNNAFSGSDVRSATSDDGSRFWIAGTANPSATGGVWNATLGATTGTQISTTITNTRVINIFNRQLYISSASGTFLGLSTVGTNLPTTGGQTITALPGFPTTGTHSSYDYFFANASTVYVADDSSLANGGGIQKWTLSAGTWSLAYTLQNGTSPGVRGLTGYIDGSGNPVLFATTSPQTSNNNIVTVTDTGAGSTFSTIVTGSGANTAFRGIRYIASCVPALVYGQPANVTVDHGNTAVFTVAASGSNLQYQWRRGVNNLSDGGNITGAQTATLTINPAGTPDAGNDYNCVVSNSCGSSTSNNATLTVNCTSPNIITPPMNQIADVGDFATFSVTAGGTAPLSFQWKNGGTTLVDGGNINGAQSPNLTIDPVGLGDASNDYHCIITNRCGMVVTDPVSLTVNQPCTPVAVTGDSGNQSVPVGGNAQFTVFTSGTLPISYEWRRGPTPLVNGGQISGADTDTLTISSVSVANADAHYNCIVTNSCGADHTVDLTLTVNCQPIMINNPTNQKVTEGGTANFSIGGTTGTGPLQFQWRRGNTDLIGGPHYAGVHAPSLFITQVTLGDAGTDYNCVVTDACNVSLASANATLTVHPLCRADVYPDGGNGVVDIDDLVRVITSWGNCPALPTPCPADCFPNGGNGVVDIDDLVRVITAWGVCPL